MYISGRLDGRTPNAQEFRITSFAKGWYTRFPTTVTHNANDFTPRATAPFLNRAALSAFAPTDRNRVRRVAPVDLGPIELP
jgi:hypothetical protein